MKQTTVGSTCEKDIVQLRTGCERQKDYFPAILVALLSGSPGVWAQHGVFGIHNGCAVYGNGVGSGMGLSNLFKFLDLD
jgi:hypothetical protein